MDDQLVKLKTVLEERERVYRKVVQDYEHYKRNPPGTPDGNIVALEGSVHSLFSAVQDLMGGYQAYISVLEETLPRGTSAKSVSG
ncbi:MAG: hypothetical protein HYX87_05420 [Chloroflexi bacterium]|nr:hypothetical protein [Chloroflexota bacterium]